MANEVTLSFDYEPDLTMAMQVLMDKMKARINQEQGFELRHIQVLVTQFSINQIKEKNGRDLGEWFKEADTVYAELDNGLRKTPVTLELCPDRDTVLVLRDDLA